MDSILKINVRGCENKRRSRDTDKENTSIIQGKYNDDLHS